MIYFPISILAFSKMISAAGGLLIAYLVIRLVGTEAFGNILVAISTISITFIFCELSIFQSMARVALKTVKKNHRRIIGNSIICLLIVGVILTLAVKIVLFLFSRFLDPDVTILVNEFWYLIWIHPIVNWMEQLFKSIAQTNRLASFHAINRVFSIVLLLLLSHKSIQDNEELINQIYIIIMTAPLLAMVLLIVKIRPRISRLKIFFWKIFQEVKSVGPRFIVLKQANQLVYSSDKILIAHFAGAAAVAHYAVAVSFGSILMILSSSLAQERFRSYFQKTEKYRLDDSKDKKILGVVFLLSLASAFLISEMMYKQISAELTVLIVPALVGAYFQAAYQMHNSWLLANGRSKELTCILLGALVSNAVGNFTLIPIFGAFGACCATLIGNFTYYNLAKASVLNVKNY
jgi:O-antigen/teichoic acid export membrane protein